MEDAIGLFIVSFVFLVFSVTFSYGKGAFLIAGYNTMSDSERDQYDEEALCKFMGKFMYGITASLFLMGISELINRQVLFIIGTSLMIILVIVALVYMNTGKRFKKKSQ